jgi:hypothetical protein
MIDYGIRDDVNAKWWTDQLTLRLVCISKRLGPWSVLVLLLVHVPVVPCTYTGHWQAKVDSECITMRPLSIIMDNPKCISYDERSVLGDHGSFVIFQGYLHEFCAANDGYGIRRSAQRQTAEPYYDIYKTPIHTPFLHSKPASPFQKSLANLAS